MNILVTGAAGYLGSIICPELLKQGHEVVAIDNFMYNQASLLDVCFNENFEIVRGDARERELVSKHIRNVDIIIPLACLTGAPICSKDPIASETTNLDAIKMLLSLRSKEQKIIYPTTNSGYGIGQKDKFCDENTPLNPISLYGQQKTKAERAILDAGNCITLRLATVFGASPKMRLDLLVNDFVYRAVYDRFIVLFEAHFKRNYIHIRDVARAFLHAIDNFETMKNEPYNVGLSNCNISKRQLCEEIKKYVSEFHIVESEIGKDPDKRDYIVSNEKIESAGYEPQFSLQFGIKELIKTYEIVKRTQYANV
ncbi:MAG: NAD-dependent epimerase/dehydratase family protein [Anaerohalosphaeraceae bacterium]|nr:NAD-dependent epimerase/dehydratase family protein [Anaerohalosphaeraceae bacterium]